MPASNPSEVFQPRSLKNPDSFLGQWFFQIRLVADFQTRTVYRDLKQFLRGKRGSVLDVGCGGAPYKQLLSQTLTYTGADWVQAAEFGYQTSDILRIAENRIPAQDASYDVLVCTEVLEHVEEYPVLILEMLRVLKPGGDAFITVPWSARYHYIPHDYWRFTPSALFKMFTMFASAAVTPRGTDLTVLANKWIVANFGLMSWAKKGYTFLPALVLGLLGLPFLLGAVVLGHLSLWFKWGSSHDPLGYTIIVKRGC